MGRRLALALVLLAFAAGPALAADRPLAVGVTEDAGKYSADGGILFLDRLRDLGMTVNATVVLWDPQHPTRITEQNMLDRFVATARARRFRIVFSVYATRADALTASPSAPAQFAAFLQILARRYPSVKDFVVHNEPNYALFWQPQFSPTGTPVAGAAYADLLARSYDALKLVDARINVIGMGLMARGNDVRSTSPVRFVHAVGAAYRASGRTRPLMDQLAYHPYPASSLAGVDTREGWPNAGVADLGRIKQAVRDAFHGTAQPTFENGLTMTITEVGWQVGVGGHGSYHGAENVRTTDEGTQAAVYAELLRSLACDDDVTDLLFFHLVDETDLRGFQSGLMRADWTPRASYGAVKDAVARSGGHCSGTPVRWEHSASVAGAEAEFARDGSVAVRAREDARFRAALVRVDGPTADPAAVGRMLSEGSSQVVRSEESRVDAYRRARVSLAGDHELAPGTYLPAVLVSAALAPERTSLFLGEPVVVEAPVEVQPREAVEREPVDEPATEAASAPAPEKTRVSAPAATPAAPEPPSPAPAAPAMPAPAPVATPALPAPTVFAVKSVRAEKAEGTTWTSKTRPDAPASASFRRAGRTGAPVYGEGVPLDARSPAARASAPKPVAVRPVSSGGRSYELVLLALLGLAVAGLAVTVRALR